MALSEWWMFAFLGPLAALVMFVAVMGALHTKREANDARRRLREMGWPDD